MQERHCGLLQSHLPANRFLSNLNYACTEPTVPITNPLFLPWQRFFILPPGSPPNLLSAKLLTIASLQLGLTSLVTSSKNTSLSQFPPSWIACDVPQRRPQYFHSVPLLREPPLAPPRSPISRDHLVSTDAIEFDKLNAMISTDQPGRFPFTSTRGMNYISVLYDHDSNTILVHSVKSTQADHLIEGYNTCYAKLQAPGINLVLHKPNKKITKAMRAAIVAKNLRYQLADTHDHHANPAERATGTFKNHFAASILSDCDSKFPPVSGASSSCRLRSLSISFVPPISIPSFWPATKFLLSLTSIERPWHRLERKPSLIFC